MHKGMRYQFTQIGCLPLVCAVCLFMKSTNYYCCWRVFS